MTIRGRGSLVLSGCLLAAACAAESTVGQGAGEWEARRDRMIESQLRARGIADTRVLEAMRKVPRHLFVPEEYRWRAYDDSPLPIGHDQTISQPYIVGYMSEALELRPADRRRRCFDAPGAGIRPVAHGASPVLRSNARAPRGRRVVQPAARRIRCGLRR